ncbi:MAG: PilN domain-containing protein [Deltaproteobacteria bacterium]|nr:PilN domain-containing protein [Deltaproteobacteria bacterium]
MLKINLLPRSGPRVQSTSNAASWLLVGVFGSLAVLLGVLLLFHSSKQKDVEDLQTQNTQLQASIDAIKSRVSDHQKILDELAEIGRREEAITRLQDARTGPTEMLLEISDVLSQPFHISADPAEMELRRQRDRASLPNNAWDNHRLSILSFTEENRSVKISGEARTPDDVGELMRRLQLSLYFRDVRLDRTEAALQPNSKISIQRFSIVAKVRY